MITIDGSTGEGGGQIIRSSLAMSAVTGNAFEIRNIRGRRKKPGLLRQHLTAVNAAATICNAQVTGNELHSSRLVFQPGDVSSGDYHFSIGSAGSTTLVAQTVLPGLLVADGNSTLSIEGGTHNMAAPPYDFLDKVYLPLLMKMGHGIHSSIDSWGFYPAGGGRIQFHIQPSTAWRGMELLEKSGPLQPSVIALISQLPESIGRREVELIRRRGRWKTGDCSVQRITRSPGPGNCVMIQLDHANVTGLVTGFGRRGVTAERVAAQAWRQARAWIENPAPVGEYLCDQIMLPMALAATQGQPSRFRTSALSGHSLSQIDTIKKFLDVAVNVTDVDELQKEIVIKPKQTD